ncbi:ferredoxin [Pseudonocardia pini]|uniref:ferredoxin n=1 Tax=Pseudonocardia pini TaxID=2758030 RepID=UPI001C689FA6|nr:ferredoxin [Pseudonocardia pini]
MEPTVLVHSDQCAGSGACRRIAPDLFGADDKGWVVLLDARPGADRLDDVLEAQDACPLAAIEVHDGQGEPIE